MPTSRLPNDVEFANSQVTPEAPETPLISQSLLKEAIRREDLSLLLDSTRDFAAFVTDTERRVVHWSRGAEYLLGWNESEAVVFVEVDAIFTPEDRAAGVPELEIGQALREGRAEDERWHMRKDGTRFRASGVMVPLYDDLPGPDGKRVLRGFGKIMRDVTERERLTSELHSKSEELSRSNELLEERVVARNQALQEHSEALASALSALEQAFVERQSLLQRLVSTQEDERRHLSRELHDQTGQHLAVGVVLSGGKTE